MDKNNVDSPLRVFLWIIPRSHSTALVKCLSFVDDTDVWMEPYNACHFNSTIYNPEWGKGNPVIDKARSVVEEAQSKEGFTTLKKLAAEKTNQYRNMWDQEKFNYPWLKEQLEIDPRDKKYVFIKDQSFAIVDHHEYLPDVPTRHVFLIKHPQEAYTSFKNMVVNIGDFHMWAWDDYNLGEGMPHMFVQDMYKKHYDNWKYVKENLDPDAFIIDGFDLVSQPEVILPKVFDKIGIPYKDSYLQWESDPELVFSTWKGSSEFIVLYSKTPVTSRAVESTRFEKPKYLRGTSRPEWKITDELKEYIEGAMPYYDEMYANRLT